MSSALKDRLKRCGRYHVSTPSPKRQCTGPTLGLKQNSKPLTEAENHKPLTEAENQINSSTVKIQETARNFQRPFMSPLVNNKRTSCVLRTPDSNTLDKNETPKILDESLTLSNKKSRRPFASPLLNIKNPSTGASTPDNVEPCGSKTTSSQKLHTPNSRKKMRLSLKCRRLDLATESNSSSNCSLKFDQELIQLRKELNDKNEELRKLKMVKMYRSKNDLVKLNTLIDKWRKVSQKALMDFHVMLPQPKPTLLQIINHLQIDPVLVHFNTGEQQFK